MYIVATDNGNGERLLFGISSLIFNNILGTNVVELSPFVQQYALINDTMIPETILPPGFVVIFLYQIYLLLWKTRVVLILSYFTDTTSIDRQTPQIKGEDDYTDTRKQASVKWSRRKKRRELGYGLKG